MHMVIEIASSNPFLFATQNSEILILTYGSIVRQLVADYGDVNEVNTQLEKMYVLCVVCVPFFRSPSLTATAII